MEFRVRDESVSAILHETGVCVCDDRDKHC